MPLDLVTPLLVPQGVTLAMGCPRLLQDSKMACTTGSSCSPLPDPCSSFCLFHLVFECSRLLPSCFTPVRLQQVFIFHLCYQPKMHSWGSPASNNYSGASILPPSSSFPPHKFCVAFAVVLLRLRPAGAMCERSFDIHARIARRILYVSRSR